MNKQLISKLERGQRGVTNDSRGEDQLPFKCSNRQTVDHPEGGTAYADCGFCPGCENKDRLDQQELELWEAA